MVLTPADVHNVAFSRPRFGKRGYDGARRAPSEQHPELERLRHENAELTESLRLLKSAAALLAAALDRP
jgi:DivIVA domain-containing protein